MWGGAQVSLALAAFGPYHSACGPRITVHECITVHASNVDCPPTSCPNHLGLWSAGRCDATDREGLAEGPRRGLHCLEVGLERNGPPSPGTQTQDTTLGVLHEPVS